MPKNIVLLSDGTGNSAAKLFKTNVWRLYQALDIDPVPAAGLRRQVAFYDEGVGSENFKPLALLGSAFGTGAWRNVRDLSPFPCRKRRPNLCVRLQTRRLHGALAGGDDRQVRPRRPRQRR